MRKDKRGHIILLFIIIVFSSYTIVFSNEIELYPQEKDLQIHSQREANKITRSSRLLDISTEVSEKTNNIENIFFYDNVRIGDLENRILKTFDEPKEQGMYEGGRYFDYGNRTYFTNPDLNLIQAIAVPGKYVDKSMVTMMETMLNDELKLSGMNEKDNVWMEIYNIKQYDLMIEREKEGGKILYIWLMEKSLFTK